MAPESTVPIGIDQQVANVVKTYVLNASIGTQRVYWHYWSPSDTEHEHGHAHL